MVPPALEPSSTGTGTEFHQHWNRVPTALELFLSAYSSRKASVGGTREIPLAGIHTPKRVTASSTA